MISPVTKGEFSRYSTPLTTSSISPTRPNGCLLANASYVAGSCMGVRMSPRATALHRMPCFAYSIASSLVTAFNPPLVSDASADGSAESAWSTRLVEMLTRWPPAPPLSIADTAARETSKNPRRLTPVIGERLGDEDAGVVDHR